MQTTPTRRATLAAIVGLAATVAGSMVGLAGAFVSNALGRKHQRAWLRVGSAEDLNPETFQRHVVAAESHHAWVHERKPLVLFIHDLYPEDPVVFHARCSHLGCSVKWDAEAAHFLCPCHGGKYGEDGQVLEGPPPRPLERLEVKIEDEVCFVRLPETSAGA